MSELKPCPFCGEIPTHQVIPQFGTISGYEIIRCDNCDITFHCADDWNTRSGAEAPLNERIKQLESALRGVLNIVEDSTGAEGYPSLGEFTEWNEFPEIEVAQILLEGKQK
ncbi:hypothetical protein I6Y99_004350 [Vibrio parahaemolyticus]|nr:hypothetical protein [Vibrio parahaemolyticus]